MFHDIAALNKKIIELDLLQPKANKAIGLIFHLLDLHLVDIAFNYL